LVDISKAFAISGLMANAPKIKCERKKVLTAPQPIKKLTVMGNHTIFQRSVNTAERKSSAIIGFTEIAKPEVRSLS
jgi:hypothetical protein